MKYNSYVNNFREPQGRKNIMKNTKNCIKHMSTANRILLGSLMFIPGIMKLFSYGPAGVTGMLEGMGFPLAGLFAWILILGEIGAGAFFIANKKLKEVVAIPVIILLVAAFTAHAGDFNRILMHFVLATNYLVVALKK